MISLKTGIKDYSPAAQVSGLKGDPNQVLSVQEKAQALGDKNVGDYLNQVVDPNYVPPEKQQRNVGKNQLGKDDFLKLMLTQMKYQDPTTPMESHEMAAQMAQFTSLEQLANINKGIESLAAKKSSGGSYDALQFIGRVASGDSAKIFRGEGETEHEFNFNLNEGVAEAKITVKDMDGEVVRVYDMKDLKKGKNQITWNGKTDDGLEARPGEYYFNVEAKDSSGKKVHAETKFEGTISGVQFSPTGPILMIGKQTVRLSDVKKIVDGKLAEEQNTNLEKTLDLSQTNKKVENNLTSQVAAKGNLKKVPMERGLINQLEKLNK